MYTLYLAIRYMIKRITAYLAVISFALGVAVLIIVTSVMTGFAEDMKEKIRGTGSHLVVRKGIGKFIPEYQSLMDEIRSVEHVQAVSPRITWPVLYTHYGFQPGDRLRFAFLTGIDPELESETTNIADYVEKGKPVKFSYEGGEPEYPGLLTGMVAREQSEPRYRIFPATRGQAEVYKITSSKLTGQKKNVQGKFEVVGNYSSGMYDFDRRRMYCSLSAAQSFLNEEGYITEIAVKVDEYDRDAVLNQVKSDILEGPLSDRRGFGPQTVKTWKEQRSGLLQAVKAERGLTTILLFLVIVVAGFMLLAVLSLMVLEKRRDIGIIRSLGGTVKGVAGIFLTEGLIIGTIGSLMGFVLGYLVVMNLNPIAGFIEWLTGWHPFPQDVYILDKIPAVWNTETALLIGVTTVCMSFVFSIVPAVRAARMEPVEAIRYE